MDLLEHEFEVNRESLLWLARRLIRADHRVTVLENKLKRIKRQARHKRKRKLRP